MKHNFDFSQPNKLDRKALWLILGNALWAIVKSLWPIAAVLALRGFPTDTYWMYAIVLGLVLLTFLRLAINYFYYSYQIIADELIINKGWLSKSKTVVKLDKIHEVNLNQKFTHKLVGLYLVGIDTAGSSKTEISINGIDYRKALALKEVLTNQEISKEPIINDLSNEASISEEEIQKTEPIQKITIGLSSLIKIGLTRNYLQTFALLLAFSFQIIDQVQDFFYKGDDASVYEDLFSASYERYIGLIGVLLFFGLITFIVLFNLVRTLWTYYNYQIQLKSNQLTISYGLTDSHIIAVPSKKVQLFQFQQNYFQKLMNLFEVKIKQVESEENNKKKKGLIVPGADFSELQQIYHVIYQSDLDLNTIFYRPHKRILFLKFLWLCIPTVVALSVLYFNEMLHFSWIILSVFCFLYFLIYLGYRNEKLFITDEFIILKKGIWDLTTTCLQIDKIQQIALQQSYFQKKRHLGSVNFYTAAGAVHISYYDFKMLQKLSNELLYKIEKNKHSWM